MSKIAEEVEKLVAPIAESFGCELVEVEFAKKHNGDNLTIFIDKPGGVTLEDCEAVHNAVDLPLDELDPNEDDDELDYLDEQEYNDIMDDYESMYEDN